VTVVKKVRGGPFGIGRGTGNELWITQLEENRISRLTVSP
jgi:hypothetical protein